MYKRQLRQLALTETNCPNPTCHLNPGTDEAESSRYTPFSSMDHTSDAETLSRFEIFRLLVYISSFFDILSLAEHIETIRNDRKVVMEAIGSFLMDQILQMEWLSALVTGLLTSAGIDTTTQLSLIHIFRNLELLRLLFRTFLQYQEDYIPYRHS